MTEPVKPEVTQPIAPAKPTQLPAKGKAEKMKELSDKLGKILKEHGGLESNVPATAHEYWAVKAELDAARNLPE